jgi:hypothetical protein
MGVSLENEFEWQLVNVERVPKIRRSNHQKVEFRQ